jgi:hypothetical protein
VCEEDDKSSELKEFRTDFLNPDSKVGYMLGVEF